MKLLKVIFHYVRRYNMEKYSKDDVQQLKNMGLFLIKEIKEDYKDLDNHYNSLTLELDSNLKKLDEIKHLLEEE